VPFIRAANAALILYYPMSENYKNCLPNGFFQSLAAGLPLLYPELPEIKKISESYELGLAINPRSTDSIRKAVDTLMENNELYLKFKENLRRAGKELSWENEEEKLEKLIFKSLQES
jgi:glycosyltransferase involved in cell wall biosynthesis